jgi:hypothetical protein
MMTMGNRNFIPRTFLVWRVVWQGLSELPMVGQFL